ncbi:MAG: prenyltransferase [Pseudomonadota bacterium]
MKLLLYFKLARWHYFPIMILPAIFGALYAHSLGFPFKTFSFIITIVGVFFAHLSANTLNDIFDFKSGVDRFAYEKIPENRGSSVCGSEILTSGKLSLDEAKRAALIFLSIAGMCGGILFILNGWVIALFALTGLMLAFFYCAPPVKYGYIGRGIGEIAILISFGFLPVMGSFYVQAHSLNLKLLLASIPFGLFATLVLYNHHFSHVEADRAHGKNSPVVVLGKKNGRMVGSMILIATYIMIAANVMTGAYPKFSLISLITLPILLVAQRKLKGDEQIKDSLAFLNKIVQMGSLSEALLIVSVIL